MKNNENKSIQKRGLGAKASRRLGNTVVTQTSEYVECDG